MKNNLYEVSKVVTKRVGFANRTYYAINFFTSNKKYIIDGYKAFTSNLNGTMILIDGEPHVFFPRYIRDRSMLSYPDLKYSETEHLFSIQIEDIILDLLCSQDSSNQVLAYEMIRALIEKKL